MAVASVITVLTVGWSVVAVICLIWPGFGTAHPNAALPPGFGNNRLQFELLVIGPIAAVIVACSAFQLFTRRQEGSVSN